MNYYSEAYDYLIENAHGLAEFRDDPHPDRLFRKLGTGSSGKQSLIRAALSLIPVENLQGETAKLTFRLHQIDDLDEENGMALIEAIRIHHRNR